MEQCISPKTTTCTEKREPPQHRLTCYYDADCGICQRAVRFLQDRGASANVRFIANTALDASHDDIPESLLDSTIVVVDGESGRRYIESRAVAKLVGQLPIPWRCLRWLALPGLRYVADLGYRAVAKNRTQISKWLGLHACRVRTRIQNNDAAKLSSAAISGRDLHGTHDRHQKIG